MPVSGNGKQHWSYTAVTPDIDGEYESDAQLAQLALEPQWFPAVENRGEGVFIQLSGKAAAEWLHRAAVEERLGQLAAGHEKWLERRKRTGSPDAEGTLGGLVQEAKRIEQHLEQALLSGALCSNDPICAQHTPGGSLEDRWLQGAACHGCTLVVETSCEMRNDYLDRALVVPVLGVPDARVPDPSRVHDGSCGVAGRV